MLTAMQEKFCQAIVSGMNQSDAYRAAGYGGDSSPATIWDHASDLARHAEVVPRLKELRAQLEAEADWDRRMVVREAAKNVELGREKGQIAASNGALGHIIDVQGLKVTKVEHSGAVDHILRPGVSLEELEDRYRRLEALEAGIVEGEVVDE